MQKALVNSDDEFIKLLLANKWRWDEIESATGIEFGFTNGKFQNDVGITAEEERADVDEAVWKKDADSHVPETYPAVVLFTNDKSYDRLGEFTVRVVEFVYGSDFENGNPE